LQTSVRIHRADSIIADGIKKGWALLPAKRPASPVIHKLIDIHDRSPVILDPANWDTWLHAPLEELYQFDRPYPAERMVVEHTDAPWFRKKASAPAGPSLL